MPESGEGFVVCIVIAFSRLGECRAKLDGGYHTTDNVADICMSRAVDGEMPAIHPGVSVGIRCSVKCGPGKGFYAYLVGIEKTEAAAGGCSLAEIDVVEGRNGERELNMYNPKPTQGT